MSKTTRPGLPAENLSPRGISRRSLLGGTAAAATALALGACSPGSAGTPGAQKSVAGGGGSEGYDGPAVSLAFWNGLTGGDGPIMRKLIDEFNSQHDNIKVSMTAIAWAEYFQKLPAAVSNGKAPEIGLMHADDLATNAARQVIIPMDDVASALKLTENDFPTIAWKGGLYQGKRYGIPLDVHPAGLFYNKNVLEKVGADPEKPPTTGDELMAILDKCKSKGVHGMWTSALSVNGLESQTLVYQYGGKMVNDDGMSVGFAEQPGADAINWWKGLIDKGHSPKNAAADGNFVSFTNDKAAFMINGPWNTTPLNAIKKLKWGAAPVPNIGGTQAVWAGSHQFVLPRQLKTDENKAVASRVFVNWISQQSMGWADAGMVPARNSVREDPEFQTKGAVLEFAKQLDYIHFVPPIAGVNDVLPEWTTATSEAMLGKKEVQAALDQAKERANKILVSNNKKYG
ncbi:ABC transporter substrate-binding protein [Microlunatus elymi]|uniref:ABC transporter substrate-binding protein n=1 Tax=Microlunatus elymi TaxID=2596828 RepID=A0A516Q0G9_9ACTN|nr:ABC transporter substrate-binding protein [Microlunatus elymi]QDP96929.1 ABC transporter substrate-binding protein [Microlunatus elymi]